MSFSTEWDQIYAEGRQMTRWPWSDLISLTFRHVERRSDMRVLELGCGAGANIPFFRSLGMSYHAFEGSPLIVRKLREENKDFAENISAFDFCLPWSYKDGSFDLVVDRAAVTHNDSESIRRVLSEVWRCLKPGGHFIGVDWFSIHHSSALLGQAAGEQATRAQIPTGQFAGVGKVHFSSEDSLRDLFGRFEIIALEEKTVRTIAPAGTPLFASWNIVARKPSEAAV